MKLRLVVRSPYRHDTILELLWVDGHVTLESGAHDLREAAEPWIQHGLEEWATSFPDETGHSSRPRRRRTAPSDINFLPRLQSYLLRQYNFTAAISVEN